MCYTNKLLYDSIFYLNYYIKIYGLILQMILNSLMTRLYGTINPYSPLHAVEFNQNIILYNITTLKKINTISGYDQRFPANESDETSILTINMNYNKSKLLGLLQGHYSLHEKIKSYDCYWFLFDVGIRGYNISKDELMDDFYMDF